MRAANIKAKLLKALGLAVAAALLTLAPAQAGTGAKFKVLYSQCAEANCADGRGGSSGPLVEDAAGNFYGITEQDGVAFALKHTDSGKFKYRAILTFPGGAPPGGMIIDTQGNLYGWAYEGFYKMTYGHGSHHNRWAPEFPTLNCSDPPCSGTDPRGTLTYAGAASGAPWDGASPLYGVMSRGGANNAGTVYELTPGESGWSYTQLYSFCAQQSCADGSTPVGGVLLDQSGVLYGTTGEGGCSSSCNIDGGAGVAFELSSSGGSWKETVLHTFCSLAQCADGENPTANLAQDAAGNLFGVAGWGGGTGKHTGGALYKIIPNGAQSQQTVLYDFCKLKDCKDGQSPVGAPLLDSAGNIFGVTDEGGGNDEVTNGAGIAYEWTAGNLRVLHRFCSQASCADGAVPFAGLVQNGGGQLYGTAEGGGAFDEGVVFELTP